jgi:hypothetical protein
MPKKYHGGGGHAGLPAKEVMKDYPKAPIGGDMGKYRDSLESIDAYGRVCVAKLKKQKKD